MVWYEPSEAERKAIVAKDRVGKELAYAPTGRSIDAGKLMKAEDLAELEAKRAELAEAKKAIEIQAAELEKSTRGGKSVPVPAANPLPRPVEQAAVEEAPAKKSFWSLFGAKDVAEPQAAPVSNSLTEANPTAAEKSATETSTIPAKDAKPAAAETAATAAAPQADATAVAPVEAAVEQPQKKPFWKFWAK